MQLIPLELIQSSRDSIRKVKESFLIDLARTLEFHRMNSCDDVKLVNLENIFIVTLFVLFVISATPFDFKISITTFTTK